MIRDYDIFYDNLNNCFQIRTKTNTLKVEFDDPSQREIFEVAIPMFKKGLSLNKIFSELQKQSFEESVITEIFKGLSDFDIIGYSDIIESGLDFLERKESSNSMDFGSISTKSGVIFGDTELSKTLHHQFKLQGFKDILIYSFQNAIT